MEQWSNEGYCVLHDFFPQDFLTKVIQKINTISFDHQHYDFGSVNGILEFPSEIQELNQIALHPKLIDFVKKLLDFDDIRLIQSDVWGKIGNHKGKENTNNDQRMHMDYPNNYLTHPKPWDTPESVAIIIYYSNSQECGGGTRIVPKKAGDDLLYKYPYLNLAGLGEYDFNNDRQIVEDYFKSKYPDIYQFRKQLYQREVSFDFKPGTVLFYRHDVWHRGYPVNPNQLRVVHNIGYKKAGCDWITTWNRGWARHLCDYNKKMENCIRYASNEQLKCLGFPDENLNYWTHDQKKVFNFRYLNSKIKSRL